MQFVREAALVGCGGFVGAILRHAVCGVLAQCCPGSALPLGTLAVNITGCFLLGCLNGWAGLVHAAVLPGVRLLLTAGVLGGFTTFSTFGYETLALAREATVAHAVWNVLLHVACGLLAVYLGYEATLLAGRGFRAGG